MNSRQALHVFLTLVACLLVAGSASAQWVNFANETSTRLSATPSLGSGDVQEKDYAWDDIDQDGDIDLISVRKSPFTSTGRFPNVLFMNEGGALVDRTTQYASASNVAGSQGFLDLTNDRDVAIVDLDGDGWKDVVTATTLSGSFGKYISHPRVYINRGNDGAGAWLGLLFDDENRTPTMPAEPRFCSVSAGDIDGDGDQDLYFGDYQQGGTRAVDVNDRLYINDGNGYFTDESAARMSVEMLESSFGMATAIADFNGDGKMDIMKDDALNAPQGVSISYNNTTTEGFFGSYAMAYNNAPYHINTGDLNNDGLIDFVTSDDGQDRYSLNTGPNAQGISQFTELAYSYSGGSSDDGFGSNNLIVDLNNDGFADTIHCDVDVDISGCSRRTHIYRNLGNLPNPTLQEQLSGGAVASIPTSMLVGTHDIAAFDINGDGWKDMVIGRCTGTQVWMNQPPTGLAFTYPQGLPAFVPVGTSFTFQVQLSGIGGTTPTPGSFLAYASVNGAPFNAVPNSSLGSDLYEVTLPPANCIDEIRFYVIASTSTGTYTDPPTAPFSWNAALASAGTAITYDQGFESGPAGWTVVNSGLSTGAWEIADPQGTVYTPSGEQAQPEDDAEAITSATQCFVTGGLAGTSYGSFDVDGGPTDLISPPFDLAGTDATVSYSRWFFSTGTDTLIVSVSGNGATWFTVETVTSNNTNQWLVSSFRVGDHIIPTATVQVRFRAMDNPNNDITEAAIDVFRIQEFVCDVCQPDIGYGGPGNGVLSLCGGDLSSGTTANFKLENGPTSSLVYVGATPTLNPIPFGGGTLIHPNAALLIQLPTDSNGEINIPLGGGGGPYTQYAQSGWVDPSVPFGVALSNAIQGNWLQ